MIPLPEILLQSIDRLTAKLPFSKLEKGAKQLSESYRQQSDGKKSKTYMSDYDQKVAYLALRMPATFASITECMQKIRGSVQTVLDAGSGPGTAFWAAWSLFPQLKSATLLEKDEDLIKIGKELLGNLPAAYQKGDLAKSVLSSKYDLVTAAYVLSELQESALEGVIDRLYQAASSYFLIVEPGTPYGYRTILKAREFLIQKGAFIVAPCTHEERCPMAGSEDWCHFAARLPRTEMQRLVKGAALGYEDEKYSYLLVSKQSVKRPESRLVKTPEKHSGHVRLTLCNARGLEAKVVSKKEGEVYREAKRLEWGDGV